MNPASNPPAKKPSHPLAQNRRRGNRHQLHIPATLLAESDHASPIEVTVTEVSIGGVGIRTTAELKIECVYHLNSFDTLITPGMRVEIVSRRRSPDGVFEIGAKVV